jgi:hypothetical protein
MSAAMTDGNLHPVLPSYPLHQLSLSLSKQLLHLPLKDTRKPRQPRHINLVLETARALTEMSSLVKDPATMMIEEKLTFLINQ